MSQNDHVLEIDAFDHRHPDHPVEPLLVRRWSPRAMTGEAVTLAQLQTLIEAARWAPSSYNSQPWRFIYALRDGEHWDDLFGLMVDFNQGWTKRAGALLVIVSRETFEHNDKPARTHSFDSGAAWQNLALQGISMGLVIHGMSGFDYDKAREVLGVPEGWSVEAMVAIGHPAPAEVLDDEGLEKQEKPNGRKPTSELMHEGRFRQG